MALQAVQLGSREKLLAFCEAVQRSSPVSSYTKPIAGSSAGYASEVIFADGTFMCDGPLREPFCIFCQVFTSFISKLSSLLLSTTREPAQYNDEKPAPESTAGSTNGDSLDKGVTQPLLISSQPHQDHEDDDVECDGSKEISEDTRALVTLPLLQFLFCIRFNISIELS
ncbi:hypothetical protein CTI12_AA077760 [Artemisia annua]|uniref:Uncharacterized protein n=1 Tax=Artemisia annua TaxID=35608 RepID=A0A2U1PM31_ARTAN|nr:hypothetical protein CTI12_AA077760 [Artemisia annua]